MNKLEAIFALIDQASAPALKISKALDKVDEAARAAGGGVLSKLTEGMRGAGALASSITSGLGTALHAASAVLNVAKDIGGALWDAGKAAYEQAIAAVDFKRAAMASLNALEGNRFAAQDALTDIRAMADAFGQPEGDILRMYQQMRRLGLSADDTKKAIQGAFDIKALGGDPEGLVHAFSKMQAMGKFQLEGRELVHLGVSQEDVFASLRTLKRWEKATDATLKDAMDNGLITVDEGTGAILGAINKVAGNGDAGLGKLGADVVGASFEAKIQRLKNQFGRLFENIDITPVTNVLDKLSAMLSSGGGKKAVEALTKAFAMMGDAIVKIATPENIEGFADVLTELVPIVAQLAAAMASGAFKGFMSAVLPLFKMIGDASKDPSTLRQIAKGVEMLAEALGIIVGATITTSLAAFESLAEALGYIAENIDGWVSSIGDGLDSVANFLSDTVNAIWDFVSSIPGEIEDFLRDVATAVLGDLGGEIWDSIDAIFVDIKTLFTDLAKDAVKWGGDIIDGIINGITGRTKDLGKTMSTAVDVMKTAITDKEGLDINSPSKWMEQAGGFAMEGFNIGIDKEAFAADTVNDNAFDRAADAGASRGGGAGAGGGGVHFHGDMHFHLTSSGDPEEDGKTMARVFRAEMSDAFEDLLAEKGS